MPEISQIPLNVPFVFPKTGTLTVFGRLRWEEVRTLQAQSPVAVRLSDDTLTAALGTTTLITTTQSGVYRITAYLRKTVADGVASSLTPTFTFTDRGAACSRVGAAFTTDTPVANASYSVDVYSDANADIQAAVAYTSNTPATMTWLYEFRVEYLG